MKNKALKCLAVCFSAVFAFLAVLLVTFSVDVAAAGCSDGNHRWSPAGECIECGLACEHQDCNVKTEVSPTCTSKGYTIYLCNSCGLEFIDDYTNVTAHIYDQTNTSLAYRVSSATCTSPAKYYYSCICGQKGITIFLSGSALGHRWSSAGECVECGLECEHQGCDFIKEVSPTCISKGYSIYLCDSCGVEFKDDFTDIVHIYDQVNIGSTYRVSSATCTSPAKYYYSCTCGAKGTSIFEYGSALGHRWSSAGECITCGVACNHHSDVGGICTECGVVLFNSYLPNNYFVHLDLIVGATEHAVDLTEASSPISYSVDFEKDVYGRLLLDGFCAVNFGVDHYYYNILFKDGTYVTGIPILNNFTGFKLSEEQLAWIGDSDLDVVEYDVNGRFQFYLDLEDYADKDITVFVYAISNDAEIIKLVELDISKSENDETAFPDESTEQMDKNNTGDGGLILIPLIAIILIVSAVFVLFYFIDKKPGKPGTKNKVRRKR